MKMNYVRFYNDMTESTFDGFLVKEDANAFYLIYPICYEWLQKTGNWEWLDRFKARKFEHEFFSYQDNGTPPYGQFIGAYEWLFDFPVKEEDLSQFHHIANFFEWFIGTNGPLHERLHHCKQMTRHTLASHVAQEVCDFIIAHYRKQPNRLRILVNGE